MLSVSLKKTLLKSMQNPCPLISDTLEQQDFQVCLQTLMESEANCLTFNKLTKPAKSASQAQFPELEKSS